ncbi:MAG: HAMP domain-containing sensor histidine kinase [Arenimonas sp.]
MSPSGPAPPLPELQQIEKQAEFARAMLARLQRDVVEAERRLGGMESTQLLQANEQLVLALLKAQSDAEASATQHRLEQPAIDVLRFRALQHDSLVAAHERGNTDLQHANEALVMAALTAQELQAAAEQAHRRQTEFLAVLAHELRNPLAPIRSAAQLLGRIRTDEPLLARVQAVIERQVAHISRLVGDLLDVSRISTGKLRLERRVLAISGALDEAIDACRPSMEARHQVFTLDLPARALEVLGDPVRLAQVFSNLLDNASKYSLNGGAIHCGVSVAGGAVFVTITDNGIGITAEALPKVFEPFVQDVHATVFDGSGLGIGLTVVRELVEAHGGRIIATSPGSGLGSVFVVTLPLVEPSPFSKSATTGPYRG